MDVMRGLQLMGDIGDELLPGFIQSFQHVHSILLNASLICLVSVIGIHMEYVIRITFMLHFQSAPVIR